MAFATGVRTAVAVLLVPNILMDSVQTVRRPGVVAALRRHASLIATGIVGTVVGTRFLAVLSTPRLLLTLGATLLVFVVRPVARPTWRLPAVWHAGLLDLRILLLWLAAAAVSVGAFRLGFRAQDGIPQATFNRAVLALLAVLSLAMLARGFRS